MKKLILPYFLLLTILSNAQVTLYVDSAITASGNGDSWTTAFKTLNEALDQFNSDLSKNYIINVAKGTYYPTGVQGDFTRDSAFLIYRGGIRLLGGFPNGGGTQDIDNNPTVLSGNIGNPDIKTDNSYHILVVSNLSDDTNSVFLQGFSFIGGYADGSGIKNYNGQDLNRNNGGAVVNVATLNAINYLYFNKCKFIDNFSVLNGGAIYGNHSKVMIEGCDFTGNISSKRRSIL